MDNPHARIRVSRRSVRFAGIIAFGKAVISIALLAAVGFGIVRYIQRSDVAFALQFTQHIVGTKSGAVGVNGVALGDMQNDGKMDVVTAGRDGIKVYTQNSNGTFDQYLIDDVDGERIELVDVNDDDRLDILATISSDPSVKIYINQGGVEFSGTWLGTGSHAAAAAGDIDGDGAVDIVTSLDQGGGSYTLQRWMNDGSGMFTSTTLASDTGITALAIADINSNGYRDVIAGGSKGLQHWDTSNGMTWSREDIDSSQTKFTSFALGDVNDDDKVDIIAGSHSNDTLTYYQHLQHAFYTKHVLSTNTDATSMQVVDFNEDGFVDIVAASQDENTVYWFQNDGEQSFTRQKVAEGLSSVFAVAVADIDGDGDYDFSAGNNAQGTLYWYKRTHAKPVATAPEEIAQMTDGSGRVVFTTTVSQEDLFRTSLRAEYSVDGALWHKAYIAKATASTGTVDANHDNPYQVGTANPIDTDASGSVKLTLTWDTKSTKNAGGPLTGHVSAAQIRVIPKDAVGLGDAAASTAFQLDNQPPRIAGTVSVSSPDADSAVITWSEAQDRATASYRVYFGTDSDAVKSHTSDAWDREDDDALEDRTTTTTTITGLASGSLYTFKLVVEDGFGNEASWPSVSATIGSTAEPVVGIVPDTSLEAPSGETDPTPQPQPTPNLLPSTTDNNTPPVADAGANQLVRSSALVILDGSGSYDGDGGTLAYAWTQLSGPEVELVSSRTINPSFAAGATGESYVFQLMVKDANGASDIDLVTVQVSELPEEVAVPVAAVVSPMPVISPKVQPQEQAASSTLVAILRGMNIAFFGFSAVLILIAFAGHAIQGVRAREMEEIRPPYKNLSAPKTATLHAWQTIQRVVRALSWPVFIIGSLANTAMVFFYPEVLLLAVEVMYIACIIARVVIEIRSRPAYGLVRDALTHAPLDLAVIRIFDQGTNRLVMTRVADSDGKFFALPPAGTYTISITKPGYGAFSREGIVIESGSSSIIAITADLMPLVPRGGYASLQPTV